MIMIDLKTIQCACNNTFTCPHIHRYSTDNERQAYIDYIWQIRDKLYEQALRENTRRPKPIPYKRPKLQPLSVRRSKGRGMIVRRVKPLNRRNNS
jgi:hypothetical protein